ncbi:hypothetical protein PAERUG_E5_London_17_VIM_2_12_12_06578 [Pseudomonas aeruginosa]|nr:hypothetical protein PAERUG_E5_London_17_VIM_2_12_12_06578 [Pseudomonas aeruginosa]
MPDQALGGLGAERHRAEVHLAAVLAQQTLGQRQDVRRAFAQRPPGQREDRQAIVEVLAETPRRDFRREVAVGRGKHADIQVDRLARTDPLHLALLQYAQQLGLQAEGHFRYLVEKNGAAVGQLELAGLGGNGAGEGTFLVAEQGGLEHVVRDRRAVDRDERLAGTRRLLVDIVGQDFLAGPGLAGDQHGGIAARDPRGQFQQLPAGRLQGHRTILLAARQLAQRMACHQVEQRPRLERLDQVVGGALAHRLDGAIDRAVGGHQQHRQVRVACTDQAEQLVSVHARHVHVADHQAEGFAGQDRQRRLRRVHGDELVTAQ